MHSDIWEVVHTNEWKSFLFAMIFLGFVRFNFIYE